MTDQHQRATELFDGRSDVVGVLCDAVRRRRLVAPTPPPQVDRHEMCGAGEVMRQWVPRPGVRGDAVDGDDGGGPDEPTPTQRAERGAVGGELAELSAFGHRSPDQHSA
jgi:hypothetical protein